MFSRDGSVYLSRGQLCVSEQILNRAQIGPAFQQMGGERMSHRVREGAHPGGNDSADPSGIERAAAYADPQVVACRVAGKLIAAVFHVGVDRHPRLVPDWHVPFLVSFADDAQEGTSPDIIDDQRGQLGDPDPGAVQQF